MYVRYSVMICCIVSQVPPDVHIGGVIFRCVCYFGRFFRVVLGNLNVVYSKSC